MDNSRFGEGSSRVMSRNGRKTSDSTHDEISVRRRTRSSSRPEDLIDLALHRNPLRMKRRRTDAEETPLGPSSILPPIDLSREDDRSGGGITLPPIRSFLSLDLSSFANSDTPIVVEAEDIIDLTNTPDTNVTTNPPENRSSSPVVVDLTSIPSPPTSKSSSLKREVIVIEDDPSFDEDLPPQPSKLPPPPKAVGLELKCAICLEPPSEVAATSCGHIFCRNCITQAVRAQKMCSLCRTPLTRRQIRRLEFKVV
ncbi:hypothetical protein G9A89_021058 [Geosiphon pyriformis]|nr:hypothetical protein G9A89_021058 [Geosiphon pyriformis]